MPDPKTPHPHEDDVPCGCDADFSVDPTDDADLPAASGGVEVEVADAPAD
ncbi:hypothetical protein [Acuticoccus sediminis]|nr:hypothetical protein [Acuticoccus sediminis]